MNRLLLFCLALTLAACSDSATELDASSGDSGATDTGQAGDTGPVQDTGMDAGVMDAIPSDMGPDAGPVDTGGMDVGPVDMGMQMRNRWENAPALTRGPLQETTVLVFDNKLTLVGGYDENSSLTNRVDTFDPTTDTWGQLPALARNLSHANAAAVDGKLYLLGSLVNSFFQSGSCEVYDPAVGSWTSISRMPAGRVRGASIMAVVDGKIYVIGGLASGVAVSFVDVYDPVADSWTPLPPLPRIMDHGAGGVVGDKIFVAGGRNGSIGGHTSQLDIYDVSDGAWTTGAPMPTSRGGTAGAVYAGRVFIFGGEGNANAGNGIFDEVEAYDPVSNTWESLAPMMPGRHGTGAATIGDRIYVPGGADVEFFGAVDTHQVYLP